MHEEEEEEDEDEKRSLPVQNLQKNSETGPVSTWKLEIDIWTLSICKMVLFLSWRHFRITETVFYPNVYIITWASAWRSHMSVKVIASISSARKLKACVEYEHKTDRYLSHDSRQIIPPTCDLYSCAGTHHVIHVRARKKKQNTDTHTTNW